jgi:hypothetical protein
MVNARGIARLGVLAVGLGIGAAVASMPGNAWADSSNDWLTALDLLSGAASPAADTSDSDLAISIDGVNILEEGSAHATSGADGDIAIASGPDTTATATGTDNYALVVNGDDSSATAGGGGGSTEDTAFAYGDNDTAFAGGTTADPGSFDGAIIFGNGDSAYAGGDAAAPGSYDIAYAEGNDLGTAYADGQSYFIDILKVYETATTDATSGAASGAAETANLTDLLSSFGEGAASSGGNLLTDLASLF